MRICQGRVHEIILRESGESATKIICSPGMIPAPGQYLVAYDPSDITAPLGVPLFPSHFAESEFQTAPPIPASWFPGMSLVLRGPLGRGFHLPAGARRLALVALGQTADRLLPLAEQVLDLGGDVILFADEPLALVPAAVEYYPLAALSDVFTEVLPWADFLAVDLPLSTAGSLRENLRLLPGAPLPCPGQVLVLAPMPCSGQAACGACSVLLRQGWRLACADGPVFDLPDLLV